MNNSSKSENSLSTVEMPLLQEDEFLPPISGWTKFGGLVLVGGLGIAIALCSVLEYPMTIQSQQSKVIATESSGFPQTHLGGVIVESMVKEGMLVDKGDPLAVIKNDRGQKETIFASISGQITQINPSQVLEWSDIYAEIFPVNAPLIIEGAILPQDIKQVKEGQKAKIRLLKCELSGTVTKVFLSPTPSTDETFSLPVTELYKVLIKPENNHLSPQCELQAGVEVKADIFSDNKESILQFILTQIK